MKKLSKLVLALGSTFLCFSAAYSGVPNNDHPTTFLGPTLKGGYTNTLNDYTAYNVLGEAGFKNFRVGGTLGWQLVDNQYFKVSAEYLLQKITYAFFSGNQDEWVTQGALGAAYEYDFLGYSYNPSFDVDGFYSHAPSKTLGSRSGVFTNSSGVTNSYLDNRRIAGSNAGGVAPGLTFTPWNGGRAGVAVNYDHVDYDQNGVPNQDAKGLGGTVKLRQAVVDNVDLNLAAAVRAPFNNYQAGVIFKNVPYFGSSWDLGVDTAYTSGKNTLPNTWNASVSANYYVDQRSPQVRSVPPQDPPPGTAGHLVAWTADPAVYIPQVLAIADSQVTVPNPACTPVPTLIAPLDDVSIGSPGITTFPTAGAFSPSTGLHFSISVTPAPAGGNSVSINPTTGVVTVDANSNQTLTAVITASNICGQVATSNSITIDVEID